MEEMKAKKYRCETRESQGRPGVYPLVKGWLEKNHIDYEENYRYTTRVLRYELTLYEVNQVLDLLDEYHVLDENQNQLSVGF